MMITISINIENDDIKNIVWQGNLSIDDVATFNELLYDMTKKNVKEFKKNFPTNDDKVAFFFENKE